MTCKTKPPADPFATLRGPSPDWSPTVLATWHEIINDHAVTDAGGLAMLRVACDASQRAEDARRTIAEEGMSIRVDGVTRPHPLLRFEAAAQSAALNALRAMRLDPPQVGE